MSTEIIVVKQLPVIEQQLAQVKEAVIDRVKTATSLICTEDTIKRVKKARAELNREFTSWEDERKKVKTAIMTPYEKFEAVYKECVSDTYNKADDELKAKIYGVEKELKDKKAAEVKEYFDEYLECKNIDFVTFEQANINITLSASIKSLKEQAKAFIDRIDDDLALINTQEHKAEILVEYKKTLNASAAVTGVNARFKAIEDEKKRIEEAELRRAAEEQHIAKITSALPEPAPVMPPLEEQPEKKLYTLRFKVTGTKDELLRLKAFLDNGGYKYE